VVRGCCASASSASSCRGREGDRGLSESASISRAILSGVNAAVGDDDDAGASSSRSWLLVAVAVVAAVASAFGALASIRGTSTKSAVSDRGEMGGDEERTAEEDGDQTISSWSSEGESLAQVCESESMSRDEDREADMVVY
jgi:hypothetical protein